MSHENDWDAAADEFLVRERRRLGPAPANETIAAYVRGELSEETAANVQALLVAYPEAADEALRVAESAEAVVLSDDEVARDWTSVRARIGIETTRRPRVARPRSMLVAAAVVFGVLGVVIIQSRMTVRKLVRERDQPRILARYEILPFDDARGQSGPLPYSLPAGKNEYLLALLLYGTVDGELHLTIEDDRQEPPRPIWSGVVTARRRNVIELTIPRSLLDSETTYRLELTRANSQSPVATYYVRVGNP